MDITDGEDEMIVELSEALRGPPHYEPAPLSHDFSECCPDDLSLPSKPNSAALALDVDSGETPTGNLPLPRELRDMIYAHLLQAKLNLYEDPEPHYHFHPAILRVNRQIYKEARETLYKKNTLIIVSYRSNIWDKDFASFRIPIIANTKLGAIRDRALRLHFEWRKSKLPCRCCVSPGKGPPKSFLIEAEDFPAFCRLLRFQNHHLLGDSVIIRSSRNEKPVRWDDDADSTKMLVKVQFQQTAYGTPSCELQKSLLDQLRSVVGISQKVSITGPVDPQLAAEVSQAMMPEVVMAYAMGWDLFNLLKPMKDEADVFYEFGELEAALAIYKTIADTVGTVIVSEEYCQTFADTCGCRDWRTGLERLQWDSNIMACLVSLQVGDCDERTMDYAYVAMDISQTNPGLPGYAFLLAMHLVAIAEAERGFADRALKLLRRVNELRLGHPGLYDDNDLEDDLAIAEAYAAEPSKKGKEPTKTPLTYDNSSFAILFEDIAISTSFSGEAPDGLVGWFDTLYQLSDEDMKRFGLSTKPQ